MSNKTIRPNKVNEEAFFVLSFGNFFFGKNVGGESDRVSENKSTKKSDLPSKLLLFRLILLLLKLVFTSTYLCFLYNFLYAMNRKSPYKALKKKSQEKVLDEKTDLTAHHGIGI